jgi:CO/xanthine dehydrogenase Mo-binding subunit
MIRSRHGKDHGGSSTCAHDCGLIVNPHGLRNQVEGITNAPAAAALTNAVFDATGIIHAMSGPRRRA